MKRTALAIGGLGLFVAFAVIPSSAAPARAETCPQTVILQTAGAGDANGGVWDAGNANLPDGVVAQKILYSNGSAIPSDTAVNEGRARQLSAARDWKNRCPGTHITIAGYSEGAVVSHEACAELSKDPAFNGPQTNCVLYSDAKRASAGGAQGSEGVVMALIPGFTMTGTDADFGNIPTASLSNTNDGITYTPSGVTNLAGFANSLAGLAQGAHGQYDFAPHTHYNENSNTPVQVAPIIPSGPAIPAPVDVNLTNGTVAVNLPDGPVEAEFPPIIIPAGPLPLPPELPMDHIATQPYEPTPISDYVPDEIEQYVPQEVLAWTPPPVPSLPPAPVLPSPQQVQQGAHDALAGIGITIPGL